MRSGCTLVKRQSWVGGIAEMRGWQVGEGLLASMDEDRVTKGEKQKEVNNNYYGDFLVFRNKSVNDEKVVNQE